MNEPLAIKLRPTKLDEVIGQKHGFLTLLNYKITAKYLIY